MELHLPVLMLLLQAVDPASSTLSHLPPCLHCLAGEPSSPPLSPEQLPAPLRCCCSKHRGQEHKASSTKNSLHDAAVGFAKKV